MLKTGAKVKVNHESHPFYGEIERVMEWENPISMIKKKGVDYIVRADDDNKLYKCEEDIVSKINKK